MKSWFTYKVVLHEQQSFAAPQLNPKVTLLDDAAKRVYFADEVDEKLAELVTELA